VTAVSEEFTGAYTPAMSPTERLVLEKQEFVRMVQAGVPQLHAAIDLGWSVSKWKRLLADPEFNELVQVAEEYELDGIEMVLRTKARDGNMEAIKMVLTNMRPARWSDRRRIDVGGEIRIAEVVVDSTRDGLRSVLEDAELRRKAIAELGPGGALDEILEAEVLDDSD